MEILKIDTSKLGWYRLSPTNYSHFLLGNLLELYGLLKDKNLLGKSLRLVVNNPSQRYLECYEIFGSSGAEIGTVDEPDLVATPISDWVDGNEEEALKRLDEFSSFVCRQFSLNRDAPRSLTYIRRPFNLKTRCLFNESAVKKALQEIALKHGLILEIVDLDGMSFKSQVTLMARTRLLVGLHGAGIVNSLFCPAVSDVLEIYPHPKFRRQKFELMCKARGVGYQRLLSSRLTVPSLNNLFKSLVRRGHRGSNRYFRDRYVLANVAALRAAAEQALGRTG
jgi:hypothetical protein